MKGSMKYKTVKGVKTPVRKWGGKEYLMLVSSDKWTDVKHQQDIIKEQGHLARILPMYRRDELLWALWVHKR